MRPIVREQNFLRYPLNELFGTEAQVRLLRTLATGTDGPLSVSDAVANTQLTEMGARKALNRLTATGFVERLGHGRTALYSLKDNDELIEIIRRLFEIEESRFQSLLRRIREEIDRLPEPPKSAWIMRLPQSSSEVLEIGVLCSPKVLVESKEQLQSSLSPLEQHFDSTFELIFFTSADLPPDVPLEMHLYGVPIKYPESSLESLISHQELDRRSVQWAERISELIKKDPSLIKRAQKHVDRVLQDNPGTATGDLEEWRRILRTYSTRRLHQILTSTSARAQRLRQSSPFLAVLTDKEKRYLLDLDKRDDKRSA